MVEGTDITQLLEQARNGERAAWDRAVALVYSDLRRLAHRQLAGRNRGDQTLDTTGLVHECYLRLAGAEKNVNDRGHFFALAARVMRQVICDYARERMAQKRGGGERGIPLEEIEVAEVRQAMQLIELDDLLTRLMQENERQARVVECRFFAGLTEAETAQALGISERSVQRDWSDARTWLSTQV
jgi:RNA polymerase sigma factor (TIGR02999 family)